MVLLDICPTIYNLMNFLHGRGYGIVNNIVYQYNQSSIRMEKNGRNYCTANSRHINIRYLFVKDIGDKKEVKREYFPTQMTSADYFTNRSKKRC